jgi:hypothetical protein
MSSDPAFSTELLLVADPKHFWRVTIARFKYWKRERKAGNQLLSILSQPNIRPEQIIAYRKTDLNRLCKQMEIAYFYAATLSHFFEKPPQRQSLYRRLAGQPDIAQVLKKERQNRAKQKRADPEPPRG